MNGGLDMEFLILVVLVAIAAKGMDPVEFKNGLIGTLLFVGMLIGGVITGYVVLGMIWHAPGILLTVFIGPIILFTYQTIKGWVKSCLTDI